MVSTSEVEKMDSLDSFADILVVKKNAMAVPLSADAEVFSPRGSDLGRGGEARKL